MEHYWEIERLQEDTPHIWDQQSGFLRPVDQPNDFHWNTTFAHQNEFGRCVICDSNHPSDQCLYHSEWENFWRQSYYEESSHFTEPSSFPSYPPSSFNPYQDPEPSEEDQILHMFKAQAAQFDAQIQSNAESIQKMTDQIRQLVENQSYIPQASFSDEASEYQAFHDDILAEEEAEQYQEPEVSVQEPESARSRFDFYYSDSDVDEAELFVPTASKIEDGILYSQNEDLGDCFAQLFDEKLPEESNPEKSEDEDLMLDTSLHLHDNYGACISQMTDEELNAEIFKFICEDKVEQEAEQVEEQLTEQYKDPVHSWETSLFWGVQIKDITQNLDRMELPFQVKHHTRPPDFLSFFAGTIGATKIKKVVVALNKTKFFLPLYHWKRPFKSNAHGIVCNRTSKTTLKPP